jgi:alpha-amylase/alpha-mannosidase (GH57 family)
MDRYVCIHGHFYQPPRENAWLESVETQDSAAPFHDWNERITSECYAPCGAARVLNQQKKIARIVNNYARISYNFGPTLLSWMEDHAPHDYRRILEADRLGAQRFGGHGPAIAQVYNHMIMPLANERDKTTQVRWGIADFVHRFGRQPEGMWLAETAVDRTTLDLLARHGIRFVVLAPGQCRQIRRIAGDGEPAAWQPVTKASLDTRIAYRVPLDEGRSIAAFFYDGDISHAVAFEGLLASGDKLADRLLGGFLDHDDGPQLVHMATDGESYGHHHHFGEMALAYALEKIEQAGARPTIYAEFLDIAPPQHEAEVHDNSSWSCFHGIERWRSDCGCSSQIAGWNQQWRTPLRNALDWLRDQTSALCEERVEQLTRDADCQNCDLWAARDAYVDVVLDRSPASVDHFLRQHVAPGAAAAIDTVLLQIMELERYALLMFTSCGWFFDDISGIETVQILAYAGRVLQLAEELFGERGAALEAGFLELLKDARSNVPGRGDGASLYRERVKKQIVNLEKVCAHYAIRSLFDENHTSGAPVSVYAYEVTRHAHEMHTSGRARLLIGSATVRSRLTREQQAMEYAVLHFGDQNLSAAVRPITTDEQSGSNAFAEFAAHTRKAFLLGDLPEVVRLMDRALGASSYSLNSLFEDEQRRILDLLLSRTLAEVEAGLRGIYAQHTSLLRFLEQAKAPQPPALRFVAEFVTTDNLYQAMERDPIQRDEVRALLDTIAAEKLTLDTEKLRFQATARARTALLQVQSTARMARAAARTLFPTPEPLEASVIALERAITVMEALRMLPVELNLWQAQNFWYQVWQENASANGANNGDDGYKSRLRYLGGLMDLAVDELFVEDAALV